MSEIIKDAYGSPRYWVRSEMDFMADGINFEKDADSGRCYMLEASRSLRSDMDGALVRRRISQKLYTQCLRNACRMTGTEL